MTRARGEVLGGRIRRPYSAISIARVAAFHLAALLVFVVGLSWLAFGVFLASYYLRHLVVSAGYHRYFSHRTFRTSRTVQFLLALAGTTAGQKGPLSWATSHRAHHDAADTEEDPHSPLYGGWFHAHLGWLLREDALPTAPRIVEEYRRFPEILFLNRFYSLGFGAFVVLLYGFGHVVGGGPLAGAQCVVWGGILATLLLLHATGLVNSTTHLVGRRPYATGDNSRDLALLFPLLIGETWHNTHHRHPWSANTAALRGQLDPVFGLLKVAAGMRLVWDLRDAAGGRRELTEGGDAVISDGGHDRRAAERDRASYPFRNA